MPTSKSLLRLLVVAGAVASLAACGHTDDFPMHKPTTGEKVTCHTGVYWLDKDQATQRVAEQCIASCTRHGFELMPPGNKDDHSLLAESPDDVRSLTPLNCLP